MVKATRKTPRAGAIRPLAVPIPARVEVDCESRPKAIRHGRRKSQIVRIEDRWRIDDEWWRKSPVSRLYYRLLVDDGQQVTLFHDLNTGRWYRQSYE